jgi:hypothetical protein
MDTHNSSAAAARFFATAKPILDGEVVLHICKEVWATYGLPPGSAPCARPSGLALGPRGML